MPSEFEFSVTLNADDRPDVETVIAVLRNIETILHDIERSVRGESPKAKWEWAEDPRLHFVASVNGVAEQELGQIVSIAQEGFIRASQAAEAQSAVQWPTAFGAEARRAAENILRRLADIESLTVEATGQPNVNIREVRFEELIVGKSRRVYSSVDGVLELVAHRGASIQAGLREVNTQRYVRCIMSASRWLGYIRDENLWDRRVIIEGRVAYDDEDNAVSVIDVTNITPREQSGSLSDYRGILPNTADLAHVRPIDG